LLPPIAPQKCFHPLLLAPHEFVKPGDGLPEHLIEHLAPVLQMCGLWLLADEPAEVVEVQQVVVDVVLLAVADVVADERQ
jgi:hypothetical protein